jgi:hypothetical protein
VCPVGSWLCWCSSVDLWKFSLSLRRSSDAIRLGRWRRASVIVNKKGRHSGKGDNCNCQKVSQDEATLLCCKTSAILRTYVIRLVEAQLTRRDELPNDGATSLEG